jgi:hypothetical protein
MAPLDAQLPASKIADAGVENVNAQVVDLITTGVLRRVLAFTELNLSNPMIDAWWRSVKHHWLFLHPLDSVSTVRRLVEFYVHETTACFHIPGFADRRLTRCPSAPGTRCQQTRRHAQPPHAGLAWRPMDQRPARRARKSTRPLDHRELTAFRPPRPRAPGSESPGEADRAVARVDGQKTVSGLSVAFPQPLTAPE